MKRLLILIPLVFLCCLTVGCISREEAASGDVEADIQAIKDSIAEINVAVSAADVNTIMSLFADDAVRIPPDEPAQSGEEAIRSYFQRIFDDFALQEQDVVEDIKVNGDLAVAHIVYTATATPKAGGEPIGMNGNWIRVYKRQSDGAWKCIYSIWSDENLIYPPLPE